MDGKTCEYYILTYNSCDGNGLEHSRMVFDLRFIPDDMILKREARTKARSLAGEPSAMLEDEDKDEKKEK